MIKIFIVFLFSFLIFCGCCNIFETDTVDEIEDIPKTVVILQPIKNITDEPLNETVDVDIPEEELQTIYTSKWNEEIVVSPKYSPTTWLEAHENCKTNENSYFYIVCIGDFAAAHLDLTICLNLPGDEQIGQCVAKAGSRLPSPTYCNQLEPQYLESIDSDVWHRRCWRSAKNHFE
ncbi:hypothetical protein KO465_03635 [Candidatus Micrarchaeota archaeon]|jgi:hypothetical protein|nr:hypothetical protein [Candidatus Micrarchaeota archaeon]